MESVKRVGKYLFSILKSVLIIVLLINSFRFGWWGFTIVILLLLAVVFFSNKEIIMNTAELMQVSLWGRHLTLPELKGKKIKIIFGRGKHGKKRSEDVKASKKEKQSRNNNKGNESRKGKVLQEM